MWQGRVKAARRFQERIGNPPCGANNVSRWEQNIKALAGDFNTPQELGPEGIDVNMVRASAKTKLPPLTLVRPKISVNPTVARYKDQNNVRNAEKVSTELNYWFRELKIRREVRKAIIDAQSTNCGYIYLGMTDKKADAYDAADNRREWVPEVKFKQPFVRRIAPHNVLVPEGYWDLEECPWVDIIFRKPLKQVAAKFGIDPDDIPTTERFDDGREVSDTMLKTYMDTEDAKYVEVHNVWCKETKKVYIFVLDMEDYLEEPAKWPVEVEGFPLEHYRPEDISDQYYGTPPTTYIMPQQKELNAARTSLRKRFNKSKSVVFASASIGPEVKENYRKAQDGEMIDTGTDEDIRKHLYIDPGLPMDAHSLAYAQVAKADLIEGDGLSAEQRGAGDQNVDSATASANIQRNSNIRSADQADAVRTLYLNIARKLWMMIARGPEVSVVRRVEGPIEGAFAEMRYSTKELQGEYQFEMDFSAKIPDTDVEKIQKAMLRYKLFRMDPLVDPKQLVLDVYISQGELNPEQKLTFLRSPDEEHKMFMTGLPVEAHERDDHQGHAKDHNQFVSQVDQALEQAQEGTPEHGKLQVAQILAVTHLQDHVRKLKELAGPGAKTQAPNGRQENSVRQGMAQLGSQETEAELNGNPMGPVN